MVKQIHTTLDEGIWKQAVMADIKWSEALTKGIQVLTGINNEEKEIKSKIEETKNILNVLYHKLEEMKKDKEKKKKELDKRVVMEF